MTGMTPKRTAYSVIARKWDGGWELHIEGVGVTQADRLGVAEEMVRDYLDVMNLNPEADIDITYELGDGLDAEVAEARTATQAAVEQQATAAAKTRTVARKLKRRQFSNREIAAVMRVSEQRVSQLLKSA